MRFVVGYSWWAVRGGRFVVGGSCSAVRGGVAAGDAAPLWPTQLRRVYRTLELPPVPARMLVPYLQTVALVEHVWLDPADTATLAHLARYDLRHCLLALQTWLQGTAGAGAVNGVLPVVQVPWLALPRTSPAVSVMAAAARTESTTQAALIAATEAALLVRSRAVRALCRTERPG